MFVTMATSITEMQDTDYLELFDPQKYIHTWYPTSPLDDKILWGAWSTQMTFVHTMLGSGTSIPIPIS